MNTLNHDNICISPYTVCNDDINIMLQNIYQVHILIKRYLRDKRSTNSNYLFHKSIIKIITRKYKVKYYIPFFNKYISQIIKRIRNLYHDSLINDKSLNALSLFLFLFDCFTMFEIIYNANFKNFMHILKTFHNMISVIPTNISIISLFTYSYKNIIQIIIYQNIIFLC
jgi:hypothetical protein